MKTTITIPDVYHKQLRKMAIDESVTLNDLIERAIVRVFFTGNPSSQSLHEEDLEVSHKELPLNSLAGILKGITSTTDEEIKELKNIWNYNGPK